MKRLFCIWTGLWIIVSSSVEADTRVIKRDLQALLTWENPGIVALAMGMAGVVYRWDDQCHEPNWKRSSLNTFLQGRKQAVLLF